MADLKISQLTGATTPLAGTEVLPIVQSGVTKQVSVANLTAGRSVNATAFIPTGSAIPTNGLYLAGTNTVGISTNSTNAFSINAAQQSGFGFTGYAKVSVDTDFALVANAPKKISWWSTSNGDSENARIEVHNNGATTNTGVIKFYTKDGTTLTQRGQIDEVGNWLFNTTDSSITATVGTKFVNSATTPYMGFVWNTAGGASNYHLYNTNATNNGYRFYVSVDGGISNYSANNVNLASDYRLKHDIEPVKSYWNVFKSIEWKTWIYNDQSDDVKNIGVIAQELQALAPELVCESKLKETPEGESPYLGIWENDFKMAAMSVITELVKKSEEQQALIEQLVAKIEGKT